MSKYQKLRTGLTANGAVAHETTGHPVLDLFSNGAALRADQDAVLIYFMDAYKANPLDAMRCLFYIRDIRGGQGERQTFRTCLKWLAENHPEAVRINLDLVREYGRWDDLFILAPTTLWTDVLALVKSQLTTDMVALANNESVSLLGKWLPREHSHNGWLARKFARELYPARLNQISYANYRKAATSLTKVVEQQMCSGKWDEIKFNHVPSRAMLVYRNAFKKHTPEKWEQFITAVEKGEVEIKATTLYPSDLIHKIAPGHGANTIIKDKELALQWAALPNYLGDTPKRILPICDVSGSMYGQPIEVAVGLSLYLCERNTGAFQNSFLTFSSEPALIRLKEDLTIFEKIETIFRAPWNMSTDLVKCFELLLELAIKNELGADQMPDVLLVITDMQFNNMGQEKTALDMIKEKYRAAGYQPAKVVFWNVNSTPGTNPARDTDEGVMMVSGYSPAIMQQILSCSDIEGVTPLDLMRETLDSDRYKAVMAPA